MNRVYWSDQSGFTIIELMVAMTVGMLLMVILGGIYFNSVQTAGGLVDRINMNRQAREMFDILAMGGARADANRYTATATHWDNHNYIFGLRSRMEPGAVSGGNYIILRGGITTTMTARNELIFPSDIMTDSSPSDSSVVVSYKLGLPKNNTRPIDNQSNSGYNEPITSSDIGSSGGISINCNGNMVPVSGCIGTEQAVLQGYLRAGTQIDHSLSMEDVSETFRIPLMLINPNAYYLSNSAHRVGITDDQVFDTYWTAFRPLVEYHQ